ncbi:hypothetical protein EDD41_2206 [Luteococcus japonicus]|uniref:Uncharacterized protein n=1 Tax=Luteococcus japonicus TaxID=33984 RepID=A0A3N1ZVY8_9ACTN|nr:hypothetical protein [Luteococcus japonicus]ROR54966.1 hypothetical protein EDD41_2206 [Luteococcus japonicus]
MAPLFLTAVIAIWIAAAVLWLLDAPSPRQTADTVLTDRRISDEPVVSPLKIAA